MSGKNRVYSTEFKQGLVKRILNGESVTALHRESQVRRSVLYRWRDAYRKDGMAGLHTTGRPRRTQTRPQRAESAEELSARRIAELERKIGQQALDLDFFRRAFKRVKEWRRNNAVLGATASIPRSEA